MGQVEDRSFSRLEWFIYVVFIPLLFAIILAIVLLQFSGYNVTKTLLSWVNHVPYVEKLIPDSYVAGNEPIDSNKDDTKSKSKSETESEQLSVQLTNAKLQLTKSENEIKALQQDLQDRDKEVAQLEQRLAQLKKDIEEERTTAEQRKQQLRELAGIYTSMSASKAAPIMENLSLEEAVHVMAAMSPEERGPILSKMDPKKAADISVLVKDTIINEKADIAALQQRIQQLMTMLSEARTQTASAESVSDTYAKMPPKEGAILIEKLMSQDEKKALQILSSMSETNRSGILTAMVKDNKGDLAAQITKKLLERR